MQLHPIKQAVLASQVASNSHTQLQLQYLSLLKTNTSTKQFISYCEEN